MKIILSPDSFKGSLSARGVALALEKGIHKVDPQAECLIVPIADGGEGTLETLVEEADFHYATVRSTNGAPVKAAYGIKGKTAVIEMARAAGLTLVDPDKLNPLVASTYGVGELILRALDEGCDHILLTVGGSGTNDGGSGMLCALGGKLFDADGGEIPGCGGALAKIARIDASGLDPRLQNCRFTVASDVTNPLVGELGATRVYGPQKGVTPDLIDALEAGMSSYASAVEAASGKAVAEIPGCGAGGGLITPLLAFCNVTVRSGIESVLEAADFDRLLLDADAVITGEGRVDAQSCYGKAISGVAEHARAQGVPVYVAAGGLGDGWEELLSHGIKEVSALMAEAEQIPLEERVAYCMQNAEELLSVVGERIARSILAER
ncbi:MAG: glycerate kinase [Ruminococcaceae bacterium]|nr:glycerate kinase [Oscillospiraceae bacterium]